MGVPPPRCLGTAQALLPHNMVAVGPSERPARAFLSKEIFSPFAPSRMAGLNPEEETLFSSFPPVLATPHPPARPWGATPGPGPSEPPLASSGSGRKDSPEDEG